jgi:glycosyltransferase involved in cell wall biosynthesis
MDNPLSVYLIIGTITVIHFISVLAGYSILLASLVFPAVYIAPGLLFKLEDVKQLAERISCILNDDKKAKEMGLRGRDFVEESFAIEKIIRKLEKLYEETIKK